MTTDSKRVLFTTLSSSSSAPTTCSSLCSGCNSEAASAVNVYPDLGQIASIKKTKLILLTEVEPSTAECQTLYSLTDDIVSVNDFNQNKTVAELLKKGNVLIIDLNKYLRFYNQSYKSIPANALVVKFAAKGVIIDKKIKDDLKVDSVVKYLPTMPHGTFQSYIDNLADHIPSSVVYTSSFLSWVRSKSGL